MLDNFEQEVLRNYLRNLFRGGNLPKKAMAAVCDWLEDHIDAICDKEPTEDFYELLSQYQMAEKEHSNIRHCQKQIHIEMNKILTQNQDLCKPVTPGQIEKNLALLGSELQLGETDRIILGLIARYKGNSHLEDLADTLSCTDIPTQMVIALLTGLDRKLVGERLSAGQQLVSSGLIQLKVLRGNDITDHFALPDAIAKALQKSSDNLDDFRTHILGSPLQAELEWDDFSHLKGIRERLALFVQKSLAENLAGINILLWGPPGTGKTEFCKTLAQQINCNLYAVGETDDNGEEPNRRERLEALSLVQSLLRYQNRNLLMFDEMDDIFEHSPIAQIFGGTFKMASKVFTNRLFENNPVPTIWIINDVNSLDETIIRRMSLVQQIKSPPKRSRQAVWDRILSKHHLDLPARTHEELARLEVSPAVLDHAVRFAQITGNGHEDVLFASKGMIEAIKGNIKPFKTSLSRYEPELLNVDIDLNNLPSRLLTSGQKQFSLCLYGPPGTGKTEYVRQLAKQLEMEVLVKKTSDLLGSYVGETERAIAAAFQEAVDNESFLVFDEADSLLGDRRHARNSWEISQVNEMLTWMESHPLPFACTTNLMARLDQASLRRFTFKVGFEVLAPKQAALAFERFFGLEAPASLVKIANLTPGDFVVVRKKAEILGLMSQPTELIQMLEEESAVKGKKAHQIGFAAHRGNLLTPS